MGENLESYSLGVLNVFDEFKKIGMLEYLYENDSIFRLDLSNNIYEYNKDIYNNEEFQTYIINYCEENKYKKILIDIDESYLQYFNIPYNILDIENTVMEISSININDVSKNLILSDFLSNTELMIDSGISNTDYIMMKIPEPGDNIIYAINDISYANIFTTIDYDLYRFNPINIFDNQYKDNAYFVKIADFSNNHVNYNNITIDYDMINIFKSYYRYINFYVNPRRLCFKKLPKSLQYIIEKSNIFPKILKIFVIQ